MFMSQSRNDYSVFMFGKLFLECVSRESFPTRKQSLNFKEVFSIVPMQRGDCGAGNILRCSDDQFVQ